MILLALSSFTISFRIIEASFIFTINLIIIFRLKRKLEDKLLNLIIFRLRKLEDVFFLLVLLKRKGGLKFMVFL